jgi:hypothetical protein
MLLFINSFRSMRRLSVILPFALLPVACSDGESAGTDDGSGAASGEAGVSGTSVAGGGGGFAGNVGAAGDDGAGGDQAAPDTTPPTVTSSYPQDGAATTAVVGANFSEAMAGGTLSDATFTVQQDGSPVAGTVSHFNKVITFLPDSELKVDTTYTATITTAAEDLAGNALEEEFSWSFTTDDTAPVGPAPVRLATAGAFTILAKSEISNVPTSEIIGDLGLSPAAASYITGFSLTRVGAYWTTPQVTGHVFAANNDPPTPVELTTAVGDMELAYTDAATRPTPDFSELGDGAIGGETLEPGLYKWTTSVTVASDVTIAGAANDVWIFQISQDLEMSASKKMILSGGARAKNIVWQVAGIANLGTGAHAEGIVLSKTAIKLGTGASINGRLLAQTAVNLASSTITPPAQ